MGRETAHGRARDEKEPGAHSGAESRARDRVVPGTASAGEGYRSEHAEGGTATNDPLEGVLMPEDEQRREGTRAREEDRDDTG